MIPKIIHYCWFGRGEKNELIKNCILSWRKFCPDYEIVEWNEDNFDVTAHVYSKDAYDNEYWAFVSDYARLKIIAENGGIYLDTDVELIKNIDFLLKNKFYCGCEQLNTINTGLGFGAERNSKIVLQMLSEYDNIKFIDESGSFNLISCPFFNTNALLHLGIYPDNKLQKTVDYTIYPTEYLSPKSYETGYINLTENTVSIHHFDGSWEDAKSLKKKFRQHLIGNYFGHKIGSRVILIYDTFKIAKRKGLKGTLFGIINQFRILLKKQKLRD